MAPSTFDEQGLLRLPGAFSAAEAAAMQDAVWDELGRVHDIRRDDPSSWRLAHPPRLQRITGDPVFAPIGGPVLRAALDALLGEWQVPKRWGAILVTLPAGHAWTVPTALWHVDFSWSLPAIPLPGVKVFAFLSDVPPRHGGTLVVCGSHRLVERFVATCPRARLDDTRKSRLAFFESHAWLRDLVGGEVRAERVTRFMERDADVDGVAVRVVELTGCAGDIVLTHPWTAHCRAPNAATAPRLMRTKDIYRNGVAVGSSRVDLQACKLEYSIVSPK